MLKMNFIINFFIVLLITCKTATAADFTTGSTDATPTIDDITTINVSEDVYVTTTPISILDGDATSPDAISDYVPKSTAIPDGDDTQTETTSDYVSKSTAISPTVSQKFGSEYTETPTSDIESSTHINLEAIKDDVLRILKPTTEIIDKLEGSTSKPAEPLGKETSAKKAVSKGEAVGILIASLIVALLLICVTKVLYNRYKMKTYDVRRHSIELGHPQ